MKQLQASMVVGEISPNMYSRIDKEVYYNSLKQAKNVVVVPHGGVRRRPGLTRIKDSKVPRGRMFSFEFSRIEDYLVYIHEGGFIIFKDGVKVWEKNYYLGDVYQELDTAQEGDVMIIAHYDIFPLFLRRKSDTDWELKNAPLSGIPEYDYGAGDEPVWSNTRGYPGCVTFFQQRLWFAGSKSNPNSVWASKINSYYEFDIDAGKPDFGIFETIDSNQFNRIHNIYPGRNLQVFTSNAEFYNDPQGGYITAETSVWKKATSYGSKRVQAVMIDGATIFVDKLGRNVRSFVFQWEENNFVSPSISIMSDHLFPEVISMDAVKGTNIDISDFLYCVQSDGTVSVMNSSKLNALQGWTQWTTQGEFMDVCVVNKVVYFLVSRNGSFFIEYMNEGTFTDHNVVEKVQKPEENKVIHRAVQVSHNNEEVIQTVNSGTPINSIDLGVSFTMQFSSYEIIADNSPLGEQKPVFGVIHLPRPAYQVEVGLNVPVVIETLPLNINTQQGNIIENLKRVTRADLVLKDSLGVYVNDVFTKDKEFKVILDKAPEPFTGIKTVRLLGYDKQKTLKITQKYPLPLNLQGINYHLDVGK